MGVVDKKNRQGNHVGNLIKCTTPSKSQTEPNIDRLAHVHLPARCLYDTLSSSSKEYIAYNTIKLRPYNEDLGQTNDLASVKAARAIDLSTSPPPTLRSPT